MITPLGKSALPFSMTLPETLLIFLLAVIVVAPMMAPATLMPALFMLMLPIKEL
jgi:hypothetical protein